MAISRERSVARSKLAAGIRHGRSDDELADLRRQHAAFKLGDVIQKVTAASPPFTDDQVDWLRGLLRVCSGEERRRG